MWELQARVVGSIGIWLGGVKAWMLSNSSVVARTSLPSTSVLWEQKWCSALQQQAITARFGSGIQCIFSFSNWCEYEKKGKQRQLNPSGEPGELDTSQNVSDRRYVLGFLHFVCHSLWTHCIWVFSNCLYLLYSETPILMLKQCKNHRQSCKNH